MKGSTPDRETSVGAPNSDDQDRSKSDWVELFAQYGWLAKGFIFIVIGYLAFQLARQGSASDEADQTGALRLLAGGTVGKVLLIVTSVGLVLFALWQFGQAIASDSTDLFGLAKRVGWAGLGATYFFLAVTGFQIALAEGPAKSGQASGGSGGDSGGGGGVSSPEGLTNWLFSIPGGRIVVGVIGLGTIGVAGYHVVKGIRQDFLDDVDLDELDEKAKRALGVLGTAGFGARGLVMGLVGVLFIVAAWQYDPDEAAGLDQALRTISEAPMGRAILAVCSLGLLAAGAYDMATWRRQQLD